MSNWLSLVSEWSWVLKKILNYIFTPLSPKWCFLKRKYSISLLTQLNPISCFQMKTPKHSNEKDRPQNHREVESLFYSAPHLLVQFLASYTCFPYFSAKKLASKGCVSLYRPPCCTASFDRSLKILTEDEQNGKLNLGALLPCVWKLWVTLLFAWKMSWFSQVSVFSCGEHAVCGAGWRQPLGKSSVTSIKSDSILSQHFAKHRRELILASWNGNQRIPCVTKHLLKVTSPWVCSCNMKELLYFVCSP